MHDRAGRGSDADRHGLEDAAAARSRQVAERSQLGSCSLSEKPFAQLRYVAPDAAGLRSKLRHYEANVHATPFSRVR